MMDEIKSEKLRIESDELFQYLFPITRSITGNGFRESIGIIKEKIPDLQIHEIPSGTKVYDWTIPKEWNIRDAYIGDKTGRRIVAFKKCNVHVMSYSIPVNKKMKFSELKNHLHTLPDLPDAIPYRTSYYKENWGFCLSHNQFNELDENTEYEVYIDSDLQDGSLTYADVVIGGEQDGKEYILSTYLCHPSLANDNLSGPILTTLLYNELKNKKLLNKYRFIFIPETIGAIAYLRQNEAAMKNSAGGFVITTVAGPGTLGYKETFLGNHYIDRLVRETFRENGIEFKQYPFVPDGSDERQYSSPGFRIPVGTICKDKYYEYKYYHTSLDNLDFVKSEYLLETLEIYLSVIEKIEIDAVYLSKNPNCEVQLGKRGLYPETGGAINQSAAGNTQKRYTEIDVITWFLFLADGENSLLDMSEKTGISMSDFKNIAMTLEQKGLVEYRQF